MHRIIYISTAADGLTDAAVADIVATAERDNPINQLTGFLLYNQRNFLQMLEGPRDRIGSLMRRIISDERHHGIVMMVDEEIAARSCADWQMRWIRLSLDMGRRSEELQTSLPVLSPGATQIVRNFALLN